MPKLLWALFLPVFWVACLEYQGAIVQDKISVPPSFEYRYISPKPKDLFNTISIGENCKGIRFQVPPSRTTPAYITFNCLWFFDDILVQNDTVSPQNRANNAIITFLLTQKALTLNSSLESRPVNGQHVVQLYCADAPYINPEIAYNGNTSAESYLSWSLFIDNKNCPVS